MNVLSSCWLSVRSLLLPGFFTMGSGFFLYQGASKYFPHYYEALIFAALGMGLFAWCVHSHGWKNWRSLCALLTITVFHGLSGEANVTSHAGSDTRVAHAAAAQSTATDRRLQYEQSEHKALLREIEEMAAEAAALRAGNAEGGMGSAESAVREQLAAAQAGMAAELAAGGVGPRYRAHETAAQQAREQLAALEPQIRQREAHAAELAAAVAALEAKIQTKQTRADALATSLSGLATASQDAAVTEITAKADSKLLFAFAQFAAQGNDLGARAIVFLFFFFVYGSWELINAALISRLRTANPADISTAVDTHEPDPVRKPVRKEEPVQLTIVEREVAPPESTLLPYNEKCRKRLCSIVGLPGELMATTVEKTLEGLLAKHNDKIIRRMNRFSMLDRFYMKEEVDAFQIDEQRRHLLFALAGQPLDRRLGDILIEAAAAFEQREESAAERPLIAA